MLSKRKGEDTTSSTTVLKHQALIIVWGGLMSFLDREPDEKLILEFNVARISAFTKEYFEQLEETRYILFVEEKSDQPSRS
jgi:hypothetical protein